MIGATLDKIIGVFNPESELKRMAVREIVQKVRSNKYAAAKTTPSTGTWGTSSDRSVNSVLGGSLGVLRARARQLVRDMPAMATGIDRLVEHQIGTGLTLKPLVKNNTDGKLNKILNEKIEDSWKFFCDDVDVAGLLHFNDIQQLACRQSFEVGEFDFIKRQETRRGRYLPFALQMVEPDILSSYGKPIGTNEVFQGVEYIKQTGRPVAYHFDDSDIWRKTIRIAADKVIIGYKTLRPGQLRGVTPLAPVLIMAHIMRDFLDAELSSAQKAAKWLAFVTTPDPTSTMKAFGDAASTTYTDNNSNSIHTTEMGNAIIDFLQTGESVTIAEHNRPGNSFSPFVKYLLQTFAATVGCTYELISGDYELKYTGARVARNDMQKTNAVNRARIIRQLCEPVRREFMDWAVATGKLDIPDYFTNPEPYLRAAWMHDGSLAIDPLREGRAESDALKDKRMSPQEILLARGREPDEVLDEWQEWNEMLKERDLFVEDTDTGLQTNPAKVGAEEGDGQKKLLRIAK